MYNRAKLMQKDETKQSTLFTAWSLKPEHFTLVQETIAANGGDPVMTHKKLKEIWNARGLAYAPYYMTNNTAAKTKTRGVYDLSKLKQTTKPISVKKEATAKKEAKKAKKSPSPKPVDITKEDVVLS
jgi:hypothetical protein